MTEHLKASRVALGCCNRMVHEILDCPSFTLEHRYGHTPEKVEQIVGLLGEGVRLEAWLHILMDWGLIRYSDVVRAKVR